MAEMWHWPRPPATGRMARMPRLVHLITPPRRVAARIAGVTPAARANGQLTHWQRLFAGARFGCEAGAALPARRAATYSRRFLRAPFPSHGADHRGLGWRLATPGRAYRSSIRRHHGGKPLSAGPICRAICPAGSSAPSSFNLLDVITRHAPLAVRVELWRNGLDCGLFVFKRGRILDDDVLSIRSARQACRVMSRP
jgi:hypothetical protein